MGSAPASEAGSAAASPALPDPLAGTTATPSPAGKSTGRTLDKAVWHDIITGLVEQGAALLHERLANTPAERAENLWLTDKEEADRIGGPLASIAHRRANVPGGADVADLIIAGAALAGYGFRNLTKTVRTRRAARQQSRIGSTSPVEHPAN